MPPPVFPPPAPQKSNTGLILGIVGGVVVLLLLGVVAFVFFAGGSTSTPTASVEGYLEAVQDQDATAAQEFLCEALLADSNINGMGGDDFGGSDTDTDLQVSWSNVVEASNDGSSAEVTADIDVTITVDGDTQNLSGTWTFDMVEESGWKICDFQTPGGV